MMGAPGRRSPDAGFALIEVMAALMLIALLAALALPGLARATGSATLRITAYQVSALLRADRNFALMAGRPVTTTVDADGRRLIGGASHASVDMPPGVDIRAPGIRFLADGRSSGGTIVLASRVARVMVAVSPDTGGIRVVAP